MVRTEICNPLTGERHFFDFTHKLWGTRFYNLSQWTYKGLCVKPYLSVDDGLQFIEVDTPPGGTDTTFFTQHTFIFFASKTPDGIPYPAERPCELLSDNIKEAVEYALERINSKEGTSYEMKDALSFSVFESFVEL